MRKAGPAHILAAACLLAASVGSASAHCCHDERSLGAQQQSTFRRGVHGLGEDPGQDRLGSDPPRTRGRLGNGTGSLGSGGLGSQGQGSQRLGELRGNSFGNYGAGSLGERGPGGLGALHGNTPVPQPPQAPRAR